MKQASHFPIRLTVPLLFLLLSGLVAAGEKAKAQPKAQPKVQPKGKPAEKAEEKTEEKIEEKRLNVLCTTFPVYQIVRNVAAGRDALDISLLLPPGLGCPHDYALTPEDLRRIGAADVLVANGLGMEDFLDAAMRSNPGLSVIDTSNGIDDLLAYDEFVEHDHDRDDAPADKAKTKSETLGSPIAAADINPHLYASPAVSAVLAENIASHLGNLDEDGEKIYAENGRKYAAALRALAAEITAAAGKFKNNRIVEPHGAFDYLARDIGLEIVAVMQPNGQELSAAQLTELVEDIRAEDAGAIVVEPQYPSRTGEMLAKETGLPLVTLDPGASGPKNAPLDHYEKLMRANLKALSGALGGK